MNFKFPADHTFFTSDTHFNHANIIHLCNRSFKNAEQMNETLIANWNSVITPDDTVFLCFEGSYKNIWQLFGHVHSRKNNTGIDAGQLQHLYPTQYDVASPHFVMNIPSLNIKPAHFCPNRVIRNIPP